SNGGSGACQISGSVTSTLTGSHTRCGGLYTETWTFTDNCGRTITRSRTITVTPAPAAVFVNAPGNITAQVCGIAPQPTSLSYSNGQTGNCAISGSVMSVITGGTVANCGLYTETWTFTDPCGRGSITHVRTIFVPCCKACTYTQGAYGNAGGQHCLPDGSQLGTSALLTQIMDAMPGDSAVIGLKSTNRYWVLKLSDVNQNGNSNIYKMLPGGGNSQAFGLDTYPGSPTYSNTASWSVVPLRTANPQRGRILNTLAAQTITMFFNLQLDDDLGNIPLTADTLVTADANCGSSDPIPGTDTKFGLPHEVVVFLNGGNGYAPTVAGLYQLANDYLGGLTPGNLSLSAVAAAVDVINNAFDECRVLTGLLPYVPQVAPLITSTYSSGDQLRVTAYPNPYVDNVRFVIESSVSGQAVLEVYDLMGQKLKTVYQGLIHANKGQVIDFNVPALNKMSMIYILRVGGQQVSGKLLYLN
ncbi:MAG TPA: T9SS type A sorting domain-containing protein, partial [Chitinophagaceae bacterium]|nr:T9SS type A sorting domain-containing protein [Chitinophagaceae bacterium]